MLLIVDSCNENRLILVPYNFMQHIVSTNWKDAQLLHGHIAVVHMQLVTLKTDVRIAFPYTVHLAGQCALDRKLSIQKQALMRTAD